MKKISGVFARRETWIVVEAGLVLWNRGSLYMRRRLEGLRLLRVGLRIRSVDMSR